MRLGTSTSWATRSASTEELVRMLAVGLLVVLCEASGVDRVGFGGWESGGIDQQWNKWG